MTHYNKNDPKTIQSMFDSIAPSYDTTNGVLSFQMHRLWNYQLVKSIFKDSNSETLLDLCCGTGEIAFNYLKKSKSPQKAHLVDFCSGMLECAKEKAKKKKLDKHAIEYTKADVQALPLPDVSINCAMMAYGIRNVKDPLQCFQEVFRVLCSNGRFGILELTEPNSSVLRLAHRLYLRTLLPLMGKAMTSNRDAYQYLCNSIHSFVKPDHLKNQLTAVGFSNVQIIPLTGGIATLILAQKK